jgi:tRNA A37 threonylcarbamoyladenosine synthetase subunit TsaC/SUA5/YrdC
VRVRAIAHLAECVEAVDAGQIVVLPTRRWYMLCADSTDADACRRIFEGKGRPTTKSLALVMPSNAAVQARFSVSAEARRLAEGLWPGDLALLLPWSRPEIGRQHWWLGTPAAMVTRDPWLLGELASRTRNPPAAAVVSRSDAEDPADRQPALSPADVRRFVERTSTPVEILVDGGVCPLGRGLTVVDCSSAPRLVREGAVHARAISAVLAVDGPAGGRVPLVNP